MQDKRWYGAAWLSIAVAALMPLSFILSILADTVLKGRPQELPLAVMALFVSLSWTFCSIIVLYRFRELLNERFQFSAVNTPIQVMLFLLPIIALLGGVGRIVTALPIGREAGIGVTLIMLLPMLALACAMGVLSIYVGARLLSLGGDMDYLVRPFAYLSIVGGICLALILLAPFAALLEIGANVVLAMIFFKAAEQEQAIEFV